MGRWADHGLAPGGAAGETWRGILQAPRALPAAATRLAGTVTTLACGRGGGGQGQGQGEAAAAAGGAVDGDVAVVGGGDFLADVEAEAGAGDAAAAGEVRAVE